MSGSAQSLPMAQRDDGIPTLTPEQARQAAPGTLFRTADGRLMRRPGGAEIPTMTPEQARQAPGTLFRTTDGRVIRARGATPSEAPAGGAPRVSEGAIVRQNGKRYQMRGGQFIELGDAPQAAAAPAAQAEPPRQIDPNGQLPVLGGFANLPAWGTQPGPAYIDPAPTEGLDSTRRYSASGVRDSDIQPRPQPSRFAQVMSHPGNDPWTGASNVAADAIVSGLKSVFANVPQTAQEDVPLPPSATPAPEPAREQLPIWRGLPDISIPSWSARAQQRYPRPSPPMVEGDR